jgi:protein-L-isoaspartate(D-aspartate) O-methyltransferase
MSQAALLTATTLLAGCSNGSPPGNSATRPAATSAPSTTQPGLAWTPPTPAAADERKTERLRMVETQIEHPSDGRTPVTDPTVLTALRAVPRHAFIPATARRMAYADHPLPIGHDQTISQPYIVAFMTELLRVEPGAKVLEIGTGSGYQAAVLAHLTPHVYTIEIVEPLAEWAAKALKGQGYDHVSGRRGDGYRGWPEHAPFDRILLTCAAEELPDPLWQQLKPGGRIVMPLGGTNEIQRLVIITKTPTGERRSETVTYVRFVPLTRE